MSLTNDDKRWLEQHVFVKLDAIEARITEMEASLLTEFYKWGKPVEMWSRMNLGKLTPYRRHTASCPHKEKGQGYSLCDCPIWAYGELNGKLFRRSLGTNDDVMAKRKIEQLTTGITGRATILMPRNETRK